MAMPDQGNAKVFVQQLGLEKTWEGFVETIRREAPFQLVPRLPRKNEEVFVLGQEHFAQFVVLFKEWCYRFEVSLRDPDGQMSIRPQIYFDPHPGQTFLLKRLRQNITVPACIRGFLAAEQIVAVVSGFFGRDLIVSHA